MAVIQTKELTKVYKSRKRRVEALKNLNLKVKKGSVFGFLGRNGAGKTTAIKLLLGLLHPTSGSVEILGETPSCVKIKTKIGYLPEISYLEKDFSGYRLLKFLGSFYGLEKDELEERIENLLSKFGLLTYRDMDISEYSKGMMQKLSIIQAVIHRPELLILDEPTSGLDPISQKEIRDFVKEQKERGNTILISSHILDEIRDLADTIGVLHEGRLLRFGKKEKLLEFKKFYTFILRGENIGGSINGYSVSENERGEKKVSVPMSEKDKFLKFTETKEFEVVEFYREKESVSDFFIRTIEENKDE